MKVCPQCGKSYGADDRFCTVDGATLIAADGGTGKSLVGSVLADRYLVQQRLGEGGMGEVYLAEHIRIKRKVAVKLMRSWMANDPLAVSRFHREAENASQISHPNVAQVYDFGEAADGTIYLAMEFVPGEPLSSILDREGRLNSVRTGEIVRQTAEALVAAHGMGILHRDLKPDNIMIAQTRAGTDVVKLVDFGIARAMNRGTQQFTSTGMIVGTPDYMSPEQLTGDPLDERSDLYALALIAFRLLTGHSAFKAGATGDALLARLMNKPATLAEARPEVQWPESLQASFAKALDADPALRHADALEFAAEFDGAIAELPLTEDEQSYLVRLSQRMATPTRGGMVIDTSTPVRSMSAIRRADGGMSPTPTTGQQSIGLVTPPSESPSLQRPSLTPDSIAGRAYEPPRDPPTAEQPPVGVESAAGTAVAEPTGSDAARGAASTTASGARIETPPPMASRSSTAAAQGATSVASTTLPPSPVPPSVSGNGKRSRLTAPIVAVATLVVAALAYGAYRMKGPATVTAPPAQVTADTIASTPVVAVSDSVPASIPGTAAADSERVQRSRASVLGVAGGDGRGTAVLVDTSGLLFTSASLVSRNQQGVPQVELFVDGEHTVRASVVTIDSAAGLAALRIASASCKRCRPVDLGGTDTTRTVAVAGDTLVALTVARRNAVSTQPAVVAKAGAGTLSTVASLGTGAVGSPLLNPRTGGVAGMVTRRRGGTTVVSASALRAFLAAARPVAARITPNDTLYRSWPQRAVGADVLAAAESRPVDLAPYRVAQGGFDVLAMTPQVLAWRGSQSAAPAAEDNPFAIPTRTPAGPTDPLLEWRPWRAYREERRAVVIFVISPDKAAFPAHPDRPLDAKKGDFFSMSLTRDGTPLVPLESQRIAAVANIEMYRRDKKAVPNTGVYVFHPADFASTGATYQMEIIDADKNRRVSVTLPPTMLQSIARDLGPWQR